MIISLKYNVRSLFERRTRTVLTVLSIAAVIATFVCMTALTSGLRRGFNKAGYEDTVVVLQRSASSQDFSTIPRDALEVLKYYPQVKKKNGVELVSPEVFMASWAKPVGKQHEIFMMVRGVREVAFDVYEKIKITEGQRPGPGRNVMIGRLARAKLKGGNVGDVIEMEGTQWTISGIFEAGGSVVESEIWADQNDLMTASNRTEYSCFTIKANSKEDVETLSRSISSDLRIDVTALPSVQYYTGNGELFGKLSSLGIIVALIISIGAVFGGMNTMYTAVANRYSEIGTLRVLGFSRRSIFASLLAESLAISLIGGVIGSALGLFSGFFVLHLPMSSSKFSVTPEILAMGLALAAVIGIFGGMLPAWRGAKLKIIDALRKV